MYHFPMPCPISAIISLIHHLILVIYVYFNYPPVVYGWYVATGADYVI